MLLGDERNRGRGFVFAQVFSFPVFTLEFCTLLMEEHLGTER